MPTTAIDAQLPAGGGAAHPQSCLGGVVGGAHPGLARGSGEATDILLPDPLLVLETEFAPAATVEADARQRLGTQLQATGRPVEQVLAVILPPSLQTAPQHLLDEANPRRQVPVLHPRPHGRGCAHPVASPGLVDGRRIRSGHLHGILQSVCFLLEQTTQVLDQGVQDAAAQLPPGQDIQVHLGTLLHQSPGQQTDRMAMAIVANGGSVPPAD